MLSLEYPILLDNAFFYKISIKLLLIFLKRTITFSCISSKRLEKIQIDNIDNTYINRASFVLKFRISISNGA